MIINFIIDLIVILVVLYFVLPIVIVKSTKFENHWNSVVNFWRNKFAPKEDEIDAEIKAMETKIKKRNAKRK